MSMPCIPKYAKNVSGCGEVHQLHVLDRGGDGKLGVCRLFQSADRGFIRNWTREITSDPLYFPDITQYPTEAYTNLPTEINQFYNDLWVDILT